MSFVRVVYPLKNPSNACLSYLDNGLKTKGWMTCDFLVEVLVLKCALYMYSKNKT